MRDERGRFKVDPWPSERIAGAYARMLEDIVERALWPGWFRGIVGMAKLYYAQEQFYFPPEQHHRITGWATFGSLGHFEFPATDLFLWEGWALAHGSFSPASEQEDRCAAARVRFVGKPDPPVIAWVRSLPHRFKNSIGRSAHPDEEGLPPMFGPPVAPAERWTVWTMRGWAPSEPGKPRIVAPPFDGVPSFLW